MMRVLKESKTRHNLRELRNVLVTQSPVQFCIKLARKSHLIPRFIWVSVPVAFSFGVKLPGSRGFKYASTTADSIGRLLFWGGDYEAETMGVFIRLARRSKMFVDVGANTGLYTLTACAVNPALRAVAFEPVPRVHQQLQNNVLLNGWEERCTLLKAAASDHTGTASLYVPHGPLPNSASLYVNGNGDLSGDLVQIQAVTLDDACRRMRPVDLVKIDVERLEHRVLQGMSDILSKDRPDLILECLPDGPFAEVESILSGCGYRFYHLRGEGPREVKHIRPDHGEQWRNFLCTAREPWLE